MKWLYRLIDGVFNNGCFTHSSSYYLYSAVRHKSFIQWHTLIQDISHETKCAHVTGVLTSLIDQVVILKTIPITSDRELYLYGYSYKPA